MDDRETPNFLSRRAFVGGVAAAAGVMIVPRRVLGGPRFQAEAPSARPNVAIVGYVHGMGTSNGNALVKANNCNIVALCDVDESEAAMKRMKSQKEPLLDQVPNAVRYTDFRVMLEKQKDIDAVLVATPDHSHAVIAMAAMQLGKHVYVQKPMTRTVSEARALTEAARKYKVVSQMGNQGRSGEGVRLIEEWIEDGAIGEVKEVHCWTNRPIWPQGMPRPTDVPALPDGLDWDLWIGPSPMRPYHPAYHPFSWRSWIDFGGGALGDMACHVMDASYSVLKLGSPTSVIASIAYIVEAVPRADGTTSNQRLKYNDSFPPATVVHYKFPARGKKLPALKLPLVRRRHPARAARGARAGSAAARERDDLRRLEGQADLRDLLGEPAAHPRDQDAGVQAAEEDDAAHQRQPRAELDRRDHRQDEGDLAVRLRGAVHRDGAARQRGDDVPGTAAAVGREEPAGHERARGERLRPAPLSERVEPVAVVSGQRSTDQVLPIGQVRY